MATRLRLARLEASRYTPADGDGPPSAATHARLVARIRRHLPLLAAALFAEPRPDAAAPVIEWYSDLAGEPVPLASLPPAARAAAEERLRNRLQSVADLAARLPAGDPDAPLLRAALSFPGPETVFVVGGQPVITFWGYRPVGPPLFAPGLPNTAPPDASPAAATASEAAASRLRRAGLPAGQEPPASAYGPGPRRRFAAALLLLALVLLPLALHRLAGWGWRWPPWGPDTAALLAATRAEHRALEAREGVLVGELRTRLHLCATAAALDAARRERARLEGEAAALERRLREALGLCPERRTLDAARAAGTELAERVAALERRLRSALADCRRRAAAAPPAAPDTAARAAGTPPPDARATPAAPAAAAHRRPDGRPACPGERPPAEAPDVAIVLDASGSMRLPASLLAAQIEQELSRVGGLWELVGSAILMGMSGPSRLDEAKRGIAHVLDSLPDDVDVGMTVLRDCPRADNLGFFPPARRGELRARVATLTPTRGTPLAEGLEQAGAMVDGVTTDAVVVVISDGRDSCGGNPCSVARALRARKPRLTINVVDVVGDGALDCLALATGGKVLKPGDGLSFPRTIREAAAPAIKPDYCP